MKSENNKGSVTKTVLKYKVIDALRNDIKCNKSDVCKIVDTIFDIMIDELAKDNIISINGFGKLEPYQVKQHLMKDLQDQRAYKLTPEITKISFKTGTVLKRKLRENSNEEK